MNNKGLSKIILVVILVAILAVSAVAVYLATSGNDNKGSTDGITDENEDTENGAIDNGLVDEGTDVDVEGASSLEFKVNIDPADSESVQYTYMIKNAGTSNLMMRIEMDSADENFIYIINGAQEKVWVYSEGEWMDFTSFYQTYWDTWNSAWQGYRTNLLEWTGVDDWIYSTPNGDIVRIYDITLNPSLSDTLFQR